MGNHSDNEFDRLAEIAMKWEDAAKAENHPLSKLGRAISRVRARRSSDNGAPPVKRDMDLIREMLKILEETPTDRGFSFEAAEAKTLGRSLEDIRYNLQQAEDMGLLEVSSKPLTGGWVIRRITSTGHDFLERHREQSIGTVSPRTRPEMLQSPSNPPTYNRATVIAAAQMLKGLGHSGLNEFVLETGLPEAAATGSGLLARVTALAKYAIENPTQLSPARRTIPLEIIERAAELWRQEIGYNLRPDDRGKFEAAMKREGQEAVLRQENAAPSPAQASWPDPMSSVARQLTGADPLPSFAEQIMGEAKQMEPSAKRQPMVRKVFVVHGHDNEAKAEVARFLEGIGFEAIILHEQVSRNRTVIEKIEAHSDVGFAVVLLTPDDEGNKKGDQPQPRARQNVILELGYFIGLLGRNRVCAMMRGKVEVPSDFGGVVYEIFDDHGAWKSKLAKELAAADYKIEWAKVH